MEELLRDAEIIDRVFECIDKKIMPTDDDLLLFHKKGCKLLTVANLWNGIDRELELQFDYKLLYPIIGIKNVLILNLYNK
jgi:hypothetical protein